MNKLFIITGPAGVGKSTISYEIGKRLEKSVVIEGDTVYNFFVGGRIRPWYPEAPLDLFWDNYSLTGPWSGRGLSPQTSATIIAFCFTSFLSQPVSILY